jgi:hypothetical protein
MRQCISGAAGRHHIVNNRYMLGQGLPYLEGVFQAFSAISGG